MKSKKTVVYLKKEDFKLIKKISKETNTPMSTIMKEAVRDYINKIVDQ
jgi:predicted DNA-binding protein